MARDINEVVRNLQKKHGEKVIISGNEIPKLKVFPSKIPMLDLHWGGGFAMGRINIIAGKPASGKTSIAMQGAGEFQRNGFLVAWIDLEKSYDPERAKVFGLDSDKMIFFRSNKTNELTAEVLRIQIQDLLREMNTLDDNRLVIVMDSLAANVGEELIEKDANKQFGGDAKLNNQFVRNANLLLDENQCFILINEFRDKLASMGDPSYLPGGWAQYYFASTITHTRGGEPIKDGDTQTGEIFKWTVKKSRTSPPKEIGAVNFDYRTGFGYENNLIETAIEMGIIEKGGAGWYDLPGGQRVRGLDNFIAQLKENKEFLADLEKRVYEKMPYPLYQYQSTIVKDSEQ